MTIIISNSVSDNWRIIQKSQSTDIWMHLKSFPSNSIVIRDEDPDDDRIMEAAIICKSISKYKFKGIKVSYTPVNNLVMGDIIGTVSFISDEEVKSIIPP